MDWRINIGTIKLFLTQKLEYKFKDFKCPDCGDKSVSGEVLVRD
jgi:hypothetical protein